MIQGKSEPSKFSKYGTWGYCPRCHTRVLHALTSSQQEVTLEGAHLKRYVIPIGATLRFDAEVPESLYVPHRTAGKFALCYEYKPLLNEEDKAPLFVLAYRRHERCEKVKKTWSFEELSVDFSGGTEESESMFGG